MKKQDLLEKGLTEEQATAVLELVTSELDGYVPKKRFDDVIAERNKAREDIEARDKQLESLKNSVDSIEQMQKTIETLQTKNKADEEAHNKQLRQIKVDNAIENLVNKYNGKNSKAIRALLDLNLDEAEIYDDGSVKGLEDKFKLLSSNEDTSFLFTQQKQPKLKGASPVKNDKPNGGAVDLSKMTYDELSAYFESQE